MDWFLYDNGLRHERVNKVTSTNIEDIRDGVIHTCSYMKLFFPKKIFPARPCFGIGMIHLVYFEISAACKSFKF